MRREYLNSQIRLYRLVVRILERTPYSADTNFNHIGFTHQRIKRTRFLMDENWSLFNISEILS